MGKKIAVLFLIAVLMIGFQPSDDRYFEISKNIETFNKLYKELNAFYVDDVDPTELMQIGIEAMLSSLDPYTAYLSGAELDNYRMQTTGKYGGIGAKIGMLDGQMTITEPYEGFPAFDSGIRAGDHIIEVDGRSVEGYNTEEVSQILRGQPGTDVKVKIRREVAEEEREYTLTRAEVIIQNVPYAGMVDDDIGYIKLANFSEKAGKDVADAFGALQSENDLKGVVLDLRGNGGGLLHEAVNVANVFLDKGIEVVSTRGKVAESDKSYKTLNKPLDAEVPLVVLLDNGSASASEIVSGAMQDLDRGVVIGQRSFGKGLVQVTRPLPYKAKLKVTTSKYYIPSGRCIQAIDYLHRSLDEEANVIPDSLRKSYTTRAGRVVMDGAGIDPDITTEVETLQNITRSLLTKFHIFRYATQYWHGHEELRDGPMFRMNEEEWNEFVEYLADKDYSYETSTEKKLEELMEISIEESYYEALETVLNNVSSKIEEDKNNDLEKNKEEVQRVLELEIVGRFAQQQGRIAASLTDDPDVLEAISTIKNSERYTDILAVK